MGILKLLELTRNFFGNILWLNLKRFKSDLFWRILVILINFMLFFTSSIPMDRSVADYIFILVTLANVLFIYTRFQSNTGSIGILLSLGASRFFVVVDRTIEILLEVFIAAVFFFISTLLVKPVAHYGTLILYQFLIVFIVTPLLSGLLLLQYERQKD
jgi:hypothetical protein